VWTDIASNSLSANEHISMNVCGSYQMDKIMNQGMIVHAKYFFLCTDISSNIQKHKGKNIWTHTTDHSCRYRQQEYVLHALKNSLGYSNSYLITII